MTDPTPPTPVRQAAIGIYVLAVWNLAGTSERPRVLLADTLGVNVRITRQSPNTQCSTTIRVMQNNIHFGSTTAMNKRCCHGQ